MAKKLKAKKSCCGSDPRCKRCPVVLKRLSKAGLAERCSRNLYRVGTVPKKKMRKARAR